MQDSGLRVSELRVRMKGSRMRCSRFRVTGTLRAKHLSLRCKASKQLRQHNSNQAKVGKGQDNHVASYRLLSCYEKESNSFS